VTITESVAVRPDGVHEYGFDWGPVRVTRLMQMDGRGVVLRIKTIAEKQVDIYVSERGHSVRIFGSREWLGPL
jgi:hypothetical protein